MKKCKTQKIRGIKYLQLDERGDNSTVVKFFRDLGHLVYSDPTDDTFSNIIISDRPVTYGDLKKRAKEFNINLSWWNNDTAFNDHLNEELDKMED